jgi:CBS domain containing-hemolysin-like protein
VASELEITFNGEGEYDTLAGFLIDVFGYIPQVGEALNHQGVRFVIKQADQRRIIEVLASSKRDGTSVSRVADSKSG